MLQLLAPLLLILISFIREKKDRVNSLFQVFTYLNDDTHREARRVVYYGKQSRVEKIKSLVMRAIQ